MRDKITDLKYLLYNYHDRLVDYLLECVDAVAPWCHGEPKGRGQAAIGLLLITMFAPFILVSVVSWWLRAIWRFVILGRKE